MPHFKSHNGHWLAIIFFINALNANGAEKPIPLWQAVPQPYNQVAFTREGIEVARYHFDKDLRRPFVFPLRGPSGLSVTRMGHPHDPESHSHHNSVWLSHNDVNGISFWDDRNKGRIVHQRIEKFEDTNSLASVTAMNHWLDDQGTILLKERRKTSSVGLEKGEWILVIDSEFQAATKPVTLGKTPFGFIGVRMAKTIGIHDGGGSIRNSEGDVDEKGVFWKRARWVDYSGPMTKTKSEGATLMDHPGNPHHPTYFHVRNDGWMGSSFTFTNAFTIETNTTLHLRYGVYVHDGVPSVKELNKIWDNFSKMKR